ncbi:MAG: hypothetical protein GY749_48865, partial [Desulfobacteraceae bacterium]|nr:hypothetical protein [Desulfobacteraceae bacterium]
ELYQRYQSSIEIYNHAQERVESEIRLAKRYKIILKKKNMQKQIIKDHFDNLKTESKEFYILNMITTFENIMFKRIQQARGEIKKIIKKGYKDNNALSFSFSAMSFIKTDKDIYSLNGVKAILEKQLQSTNPSLINDLHEIIGHRDFLSHGKRFTDTTESTFTITEIKDKLIEIITCIAK